VNNSWLPAHSNLHARLRVFCFPHAGAGASTYRMWSASLAKAGLDVCPVQLPGRENRMGEPAFHTVRPLVEALVDGVTDQLDRPFVLFGHSMGALVAFEFTRALRALGGPLPIHLFVSGRIAPQLADPRTKLFELPDTELGAQLVELGGIPAAVRADLALMAFQLPLLRADLALNETYTYVPEAPLAVPITAFGGERDPKVTEAEVRAWAVQTSDRFTARMLAGGHFFVQESVESLLRFLVVDLSRTLAAPHTVAGPW
jgi:medium-chain acyl-[acyl-carrier-protein] hydrolase